MRNKPHKVSTLKDHCSENEALLMITISTELPAQLQDIHAANDLKELHPKRWDILVGALSLSHAARIQ